jgi:hypothetical protein
MRKYLSFVSINKHKLRDVRILHSSAIRRRVSCKSVPDVSAVDDIQRVRKVAVHL